VSSRPLVATDPDTATNTVSQTPRLQIRGVSKTFGRTKVLDNVDLTVAPGEVHALLGQNGSGKSTLIKVLSGLHRPDSGARITIDGETVAPPITPVGMGALGLTFVHQSLGLIPGHTVTENIRLGRLRRRGWRRLIGVFPDVCGNFGGRSAPQLFRPAPSPRVCRQPPGQGGKKP